MRRLFFLTPFILCILLNSCCEHKDSENCHYSIALSNNSDKILYAKYDSTGYPDSTNHFHGPSPLNRKECEIGAYEQNNKDALCVSRPTSSGCFELAFKSRIKTVMIFIYDSDSLKTISFINSNYDRLVLQRYDITLEDLQKLDWKITYPPDERMKNVKMYPPYVE